MTGSIVVFLLVVVLVIGYAQPVNAQFSNQPFILQEIPKFKFAGDELLKRIAPDVDFSYRIQIIGEDLREFLTFNPLEKAELKLKHAQERQDAINRLDVSGNQIPIEFEERRIQKLNEARLIIEEKDNSVLTSTFESLREMGELNDIRILYSQLPRVINADDDTKREYNEKVNSLDTWKNNCMGEFDVDSLKPLSQAVKRLEIHCPKLVDLQDKFGYERIKLMVSGTI